MTVVSLPSSPTLLRNDISSTYSCQGNCYFWPAPGQPLVLPARILNFDEVGAQFPDKTTEVSQVSIKACGFAGEIRQAESSLSNIVRELIVTGGVEFYLPQTSEEDSSIVACYKTRLAASHQKMERIVAATWSWLDQVPDKPAFGRLPISGRFI